MALQTLFISLLLIIPSTISSSYLPRLDTKFGIKYDEALDAIYSIAIRLEALLNEHNLKSSKNFMVSPLSMAVAVGELMLGANGSFVEQLHDLLVIDEMSKRHDDGSVRHLGGEDISHHSLHQQLGALMQNLENEGTKLEAYKLKTSSILFVQRDIRMKEAFKRNIDKYYGTKIKELNFERDPYTSLSIVNAWCRNATNGLIRELSSTPFPSYTAAVLANAVYFKADWEVPFSSEVNKRGIFKISPYNSVNVTYMIGEFENYRYVENKDIGCRMVIIPYTNSEVFMYILMPNPSNGQEYNINEFTKNLRSNDIQNMIANAQERKVTMVLPKMSLSNTINMLEPLKKYQQYKSTPKGNDNNNIASLEDKVINFNNITRNINKNTKFDLSNMSDDPRFSINNLYQQMTLSVNEKGTEAAAITAGIVDYIMDSVVFRVDRPFLFFIQHDVTKATLFWGTIVDPTEEN